MNDREFAAKMRKRRGEPAEPVKPAEGVGVPWPERVASEVGGFRDTVYGLMKSLQDAGYGPPNEITRDHRHECVYLLWGATILTVDERRMKPFFHVRANGRLLETSNVVDAFHRLIAHLPVRKVIS